VTDRGRTEQIDVQGLAEHPALAKGNVLDLRPAASFVAGHVPGAFSFPLAITGGGLSAHLARELPSFLLPARHEPMVVLADEVGPALEVARELAARGRWRTDACGLRPDPAATTLLRETGPGRPGLWSPPPFLERWVEMLPPPAAGPLLDLGCGSGRAAVWLAARGWRVTAIDHQAEALEMGRGLADRANVAVDWRLADLRRPESLPAGGWAGALMFRYLDRPLIARLPSVLATDAVVMLSTFRHAPGYVGNPQPRHRLARGEAARLWHEAGANVLVHEEGFDADGRPTAGLVARCQPAPPQVT